MKKLLLCLMCAFPFFMSCSDDDDEKGMEDSIITVKNGSYQSGDLPSGNDSFISDLQVNENAINGGASLITFISSEQLSDLYVGIKGLKGYYECPLNSVKITSTQGDSYEYEVTLLFNTELSEEKFAISLSAVSKSGKTNKVLHSDEIDVVEVATGKLQISLSWDQMDDVDLYLLEPDDNVVYYGNRFSSDNSKQTSFDFYCKLVEKYTNHSTAGLSMEDEDDLELLDEYIEDIPETVDFKNEIKKYAEENKNSVYGFLDLDSNAGCKIDGVNNENITYLSKAKEGEYLVAVNLYAKCNTRPGAKYTVTVNYDGKPATIASKQSGKFADNYEGNLGDIRNNLEVIGTFKIKGGKLEVVSSTYSSHMTPQAFSAFQKMNKLEKLSKK